MMKRRILCGILSLVLLFSLLPTAAFATGETESGLKASALTAKAGDEITETYTVPNEDKGCAVSLVVCFDKARVQLKSATPWTTSGIGTSTSSVEASNADGEVVMTANEQYGDEFTIPAGTVLLTAVFTAQADVTGSAQFSVKTDAAIITDAMGDSLDEAAGLDNSPVAVAIPITDPNAISATVTAPVKGQPLATTATVAADAPYTVATENHSFLWFEGKGTEGTQVTGNAKPNQVYTVRLTLVAKEGESFDVASLNGKTNTAGWTIVTLGAPDAPTANKLWLVKIFQATGKAAALGGTVMISGQAMFGYTLTADTSALNYNGEAPGTLGYRWMRDDVAIKGATDRSYKLVQEDIGHNISVEVWNSNNTGSVTSTSAVFVQKALNGENPDAPTLVSKTADSITIRHDRTDVEYLCVEAGTTVTGSAVWTTETKFTNLNPNRTYDIYARVKESETHKASPASADKLTVKTDKAYADLSFIETLKSALKPYNGVYDGTAHNALDVTGLGTSSWTVTFSTDGNNYSSTMPQVTNVSDSKKVYVTFSNDDYSNQPICEYNVFVTAKSITSILPNAAEQTYTGSALTTTVSPKDYLNGSEYALVAGKDYTVDYTGYDNINVATGGKFKLKGNGNYGEEKEWTFTIKPKTITPTIAAIPAQTYTGGKLTPYFSVRTESGSAMTVGKDYTVSYSNNEDAGTATVTLHPISETEGTSNYTFTDNIYTANFTINKAAFPNSTTASMNVRSNEAKTGVQYKLPTLMNVTGATYGTVTTEGDLITNATLGANDTLTFDTSAMLDGTVGKIKVTITEGKNYEGATFVLTVTAKDKDDAGVSITGDVPTSVTYGETFTLSASKTAPDGGEWTWESSNRSILEIVSGGDTDTVTVKAVKASTAGASLTAKYSSETHEGIATTTAYPVSQQPIAVAFIDLYDREYDGTLVVYPSEVDTRKMSIGGKFAGDDVSVIVTDGSYDKKNAGSRTAELTLELDGTAKDNYYLPVPTYTVENAQITPKGVTIGGATVASSKEYDGTTNADITSTSYTVDGAISGDKVSVDAANAKASYESKDVGTGKNVTFSGFSLTGDDAKNYKLTAQPTATADITRRTLTVTSITVADKTYDGTTDAQITNIAYGNIVSGDQVYAKITASFADANAGENKSVTFKVEHLEGKDARNYQLIVSDLPAATATIRKAQLVGAPAFDKVTKTGITLREFTDAGGVITAGVRGVNGENVSYQFIWTDREDTVIEANKSYAWTIKSFDSNYESLTGSTVLYPVSTSYSDQVKKQSEEFEAKKRGELPEDELDFRDVYEDDYFFDAVQWAAENGITGGVGNGRFGPSLDCSRGQTMTFLWRASGEPEPDPISTDLTDVAADSYYYEAVLWAMQEGVTTGAGGNRFAPDATVTRGQFVTFLYRLAGASSDGVHPFADVPAGSYYEKAIAWAFAEGITRGTSGTTFSPDAPCTRAQIITFLYRYFNR